MYFYYPCPKCGKSISEWEDAEGEEYDTPQRLIDATKEHFSQWHYPQDLIWTDEEFRAQINENLGQSEEKPLE
jgi:hypothetical protein